MHALCGRDGVCFSLIRGDVWASFLICWWWGSPSDHAEYSLIPSGLAIYGFGSRPYPFHDPFPGMLECGAVFEVRSSVGVSFFVDYASCSNQLCDYACKVELVCTF